MLQKEGVELPTPLYEALEGGTLHPQTEVDGQTLQMDTVAGQQLNVAVIHEADAVQVDNLQVGGVRTDLTDVDYLINLLFLLIS